MSLWTSSRSVPTLRAGAHDVTSQAAVAATRKAFRALHERGCFVIPNPWDVGSARYLQNPGFPALATTSAGFAFSQGLPDSGTVVSSLGIGRLHRKDHGCGRTSGERGLHVRVWPGAGGRNRQHFPRIVREPLLPTSPPSR
jgi:hypothetical protein